VHLQIAEEQRDINAATLLRPGQVLMEHHENITNPSEDRLAIEDEPDEPSV